MGERRKETEREKETKKDTDGESREKRGETGSGERPGVTGA